jgi:hypothetical protein
MARLRLFLVVSLGVLPVASLVAAQEILPLFEPDVQTTTLGISEFPHPIRMAVIENGQGIRMLVKDGDPIFRGGDARAVGMVQAVGPDGLGLRSTDGKLVRVLPGLPIPGAPDLLFRRAVLVKTLEYRHRVAERNAPKTLGGELYLIELHGSRGILQRDVDPPLSPTEAMAQRLAAIQPIQVMPHVWEVDARDIRAAMDSGEAIVSHALSQSRVDLSSSGGIGLEVKTPIADVRVDQRGFLITSPNLAERAGLQVGDRILGVNGMPIDGLVTLIQAYRAVKGDSSTRAITLTIERNDQPLTLTYRIR